MEIFLIVFAVASLALLPAMLRDRERIGCGPAAALACIVLLAALWFVSSVGSVGLALP